MQIGLRNYKIKVYHNHKTQFLTSDKGPADLLHFARSCCSAIAKNSLDDDKTKIVRFEPDTDFKNSAHGLLKYGKYGYGSEVQDRKSGTLKHIRTIVPSRYDSVILSILAY